jgi:general secretion pathway protein J
MSKRGRSDAGFTVIELIITLALMGFVLVAIGTAVRVISRGFDKGSALISEQEMLSRAAAVIRDDIARMQRHILRDDRRLSYAFRGEEGALRFVVVEPPYPSEPGPYAVAYATSVGGGVGRLVRSRAPIGGSLFDIDRLDYKDAVTLIEGPFSVAFSFRDAKSTSGAWSKVWLDRNSIPLLVQVQVRDLRSGQPAIPALFVQPRITGEHGCVRAGTPRTTRTDRSAPGSEDDNGGNNGGNNGGDEEEPPPLSSSDPRTPPKLSETLAARPAEKATPPPPVCSDADGVLPKEITKRTTSRKKEKSAGAADNDGEDEE